MHERLDLCHVAHVQYVHGQLFSRSLAPNIGKRPAPRVIRRLVQGEVQERLPAPQVVLDEAIQRQTDRVFSNNTVSENLVTLTEEDFSAGERASARVSE